MAKKKPAPKKRKVSEEVIEELQAEAVEVNEQEAAVIVPKKSSSTVRYWKRPVFFQSIGETVTGVVTKEHLALFKKSSPDSDIEAWTLDYDPEAKRHEQAKKKMKERLGLK